MQETERFLHASKPIFFSLLVLVLQACGGGSDPSPPSPPPLSVSILGRTVLEPSAGARMVSFPVSLSKTSNEAVQVAYGTQNGTALDTGDYGSSSGTLMFAPGETTKAITVNINSDTVREHDKVFYINLSNPVGATLGVAQAMVTIVDYRVVTDTGVTTCGNASDNTLSCPQVDFPRQDAEYGVAGFSFTKLDTDGNDLAATAPSWVCVRDERTGLIWEVKTSDSGLRDKNNTYTWYNTNGSTNGGNSGAISGGTCTGGIGCNTQAYVGAVNSAGLCGGNNWRLPTTEELASLVHYGAITQPSIDTNYFPDIVTGLTGNDAFWASESDAGNELNAWIARYELGGISGVTSVMVKMTAERIRLVRP